MQVSTGISTGLPRHRNASARLFAGAHLGGVMRRSIREVEREVGRDAFVQEVRRRRFHLVECGEHFIVICNPANLKVIV